MAHIYLVRHAEPAESWASGADSPLSEKGRIQAESAMENLPKAAKIYTSPLLRCRQTAEIYADHHPGCEVMAEDRIREIPTPKTIRDRQEWLNATLRGNWPDMPDFLLDWRKNLLHFVDLCDEDSILFTHFIVINTIVGHARGVEEVVSFYPDHASVTVLQSNELSWSVELLGVVAQTPIA